MNTTKLPESDLAIYLGQFNDVRHYSLLEYISFYQKEPAFYTFNYIMYYLTFGNYKVYILTLTVISYFALFMSLSIFYKHINPRNNQILFAIALAALFPQLFSLSSHLLRQFLASGLLMYYIVNKIFLNKNKWWILLASIFTHTTIFLFLPFLYLSLFKNKITIQKAAIILPVTIVCGIYFDKILLFVSGFLNFPSFISYGLSRVLQDRVAELSELPLIAFVLLGLLVMISLYFIYIKKPVDNRLVHFLNIFLIIPVFVILNINNSELCLRYFFFVYFFFPFIFILPFAFIKSDHNFARYSVLIVFFALFLNQIDNGQWVYAPLSSILTNTFFSYFGT